MVDRWYAKAVSAVEDGPLVFYGDYAAALARAERAEAAHAETQARLERERAAFQKLHETTTISRLYAEAQRDEALKALEETDRILRDIERHETTRVVDAQDRLSAARRALTGGGDE